MNQPSNVIIIGGGPAGYTAAIYTARANLNPLVFEGVQYGGALMQTTEVENFPGFVDGIQGPELMDTLRKQAERYGSELVADDVTSVDLTGPIKTVVVEGRRYDAKAVVLAMGSAYRSLGMPNEQRFLGRGVSWCCDLRRVLLPRRAHRRHRGWRFGARGGHVPVALRRNRHRNPPAKHPARIKDHAATGL